MLRASIRSARVLGSTPVAAAAGRQWQATAARSSGALSKRYFADEKKIDPGASKPAALPASETRTAASAPLPPGQTSVDSASISPGNVPLTPPPPPAATASSASATISPPAVPPAPLPKKKGFFRRLRNLILTLSLLGALTFGGGVWYSRINDNFHDFFTEYVPFGEQAVLYLEEMDFRKRFPNISNRSSNRPAHEHGENVVKIPAQSGASWRVADSGPSSGRHSSAELPKTAAKAVVKKEEPKPAEAPKAEPVKVATAPPAATPETAPSTVSNSTSKPKNGGATAKAVTAASDWKPPEVDEPSRWPPASPISPLKVNDANEPVVQDLVHMLNDIITVINADKANEKYGATIGKAKNELNAVGRKIKAIKAAAEQSAADQLKGKTSDFEKAATDLVNRVEAAMIAQEDQWRQQFEAEIKKLKESYDERLKVMTDRERQLSEEKVGNRLLEQAVELSRQFSDDLKSRVEQEREGRLGKLTDLSSAVSDLEKLTVGWNEVVDTNLRTQQLHQAVEAVRASLGDSSHPRPFIKELVALKEIAAEDAVVDAAIASINPAAYQRGISTPADLIDRFRRVAAEVRKASLLPDDAGVASHASSWLLSKVLFKKQGLAAGDDAESILTRTQTYLEEGDLDNAAREMNELQGWAKTLSRDWLGEVRKVLEVQQALEVMAIEARLQSLKLE